VDALEEFIRNELFPHVARPVSAPASAPASPPSPPPSLVRGPLPGIGLDLSWVQDREIREWNAGVVCRRANEALKERGITCLGVNSKGRGDIACCLRRRIPTVCDRTPLWLGLSLTRERFMESNSTLFELIGHIGRWQQTS
jgi:hypothetical protein